MRYANIEDIGAGDINARDFAARDCAARGDGLRVSGKVGRLSSARG